MPSKRTFVVQEHNASHLHYDFRLQINGVLRSWAVPKVPLNTKGIRRLAVQVEDHPLEYAKFEGKIPEGTYGAGTVKIWDHGFYDLKKDSGEKIEFTLYGQKLSGDFVLVRFRKAGEKEWLLMKV